MEHIKLDELHSYIENQLSDDLKRAVEAHLAFCEKCRRAMKAIPQISSGLKRVFGSEMPSDACPEDWAIAALIKKELAPYQEETVRAHLSDCGFCVERAAVYYKADIQAPSVEAATEWKEKAVNAISAEKVEEAANEAHPFRVIDLFKKTFKPAALPGYALAAAASIILMIWISLPEQPKVVTIAATERLAFKKAGPQSSFGFMGDEEFRKTNAMSLSIDNDELSLKWKEIEGAKGYIFSLYESSTEKNVVSDLKTEKPAAIVGVAKIKRNELYRWVITGIIGEEESFEYTGEFVVAE